MRIQQALASAACQAALVRHEAAADAAVTGAATGTATATGAALAAAQAIAAAKARASDAALLAGRFGVQAHGAIGFTAEADIGLYLKAALRLAAYLGNGTQQRRRHGALMRAPQTGASGETR